MNQLFQKFIAEFNIKTTNYLEIIRKHHSTFYSIDKNAFISLIKLIYHHLEKDMSLILLVDHQIFLFELSAYRIIPESYMQKIKEYALRDEVLSSVSIEIYYQLALYGMIEKIDSSRLENYSVFNQNIYLKTLLFFE